MTVYGTDPTIEQVQTLVDTVGAVDPTDPVATWRKIVAAFDHHHVPTPFTIRFRPKDIAEVEIDGATLMIDTADISVSQPIVDGTYEPHLLAFVRGFLKPGMTFVDVGANVGLYSVLAAGLVGPTGRVVSVEPNSENCRLLLTSAARNRQNQIELHPLACGTERGHAVIRTALGSNGGFIAGVDDAVLDPTAMVVAVAPARRACLWVRRPDQGRCRGCRGVGLRRCRADPLRPPAYRHQRVPARDAQASVRRRRARLPTGLDRSLLRHPPLPSRNSRTDGHPQPSSVSRKLRQRPPDRRPGDATRAEQGIAPRWRVHDTHWPASAHRRRAVLGGLAPQRATWPGQSKTRNAARSSPTNTSGTSQAAKWPPASSSFQYWMSR